MIFGGILPLRIVISRRSLISWHTLASWVGRVPELLSGVPTPGSREYVGLFLFRFQGAAFPRLKTLENSIASTSI